MNAPLLALEHLSLRIPVRGRLAPVVHDVSFHIDAGESVGLVGESGSGKSMTARAIMQLTRRGWVTGGSIRLDGEEILTMSQARLRRMRGAQVSMIYQDPRAHTNPLRTNGDSLTEGMLAQGIPRHVATQRAIDLLAAVGIPDGQRRMRQYPHELSGGLLQRIMIAAAISTRPALLLADEPTTALDVTTQQEVMAILDEQRAERDLSLLVITHDLDLASAVTDRIAVMYAGMIVEIGPSADIHDAAAHPYTRGLLGSRPTIGSRERITTIPGRPVSAFEVGPGCVFASRCQFAIEVCESTRPVLRDVGNRQVACHRVEELTLSAPALTESPR